MQPVKKIVLENGYEIVEAPFYTLIIDGTSLLKVCFADKDLNSNGELTGPIFQFLLQVKMILNKRDFSRVFCFWDAPLSGLLRYDIYPDYKKHRDKQYSEYDRQLNLYVRNKLSHIPKTQKQIDLEEERKRFDDIRAKLFEILEELCFRQCFDEFGSEADDLISYVVQNRKKNEKIYIISRDNDITQLINDDVCVYQPTEKLFLHKGNFKEKKGLPLENLVLKKILCGDSSDNIKGIKGLGENTLYKLFPDIISKPLEVEDIINQAKILNEARINNKQKPLKVLDNIINGITDGCQDNIFEINKKIIDLKQPLLTDECREELEALISCPLDMNGRDLNTLYQLLDKYNIEKLLGTNFSSFFYPFKKVIEKEKDFFNNV
jgi:5'-3' exonuclease